ncbi:hypothetical protein HOK76_01110, partial [archaeon]|nr:hypothetical protein [archaeon]
KKAHKDTFKKLGRIYAREKITLNLEQFLEKWQRDDKRKIKDMYVSELKVI